MTTKDEFRQTWDSLDSETRIKIMRLSLTGSLKPTRKALAFHSTHGWDYLNEFEKAYIVVDYDKGKFAELFKKR